MDKTDVVPLGFSILAFVCPSITTKYKGQIPCVM